MKIEPLFKQAKYIYFLLSAAVFLISAVVLLYSYIPTVNFITAAAPSIKIENSQDLFNLRDSVNNGESSVDMGIVLINDIDISSQDQDWVPIGTPDNPFSGHFNGLENSISGLSMDAFQENEDKLYSGLFGFVKDATIINLELHIGMDFNNISNDDLWIGGIAASIIDSQTFNLTVRGYIDAQVQTQGKIMYGAAFAYAENSDIDRVRNYVNATHEIDGQSNYIGGIVGDLNSSSLFHSYNVSSNMMNVNVVSNDRAYIGGLAGRNNNSTIYKAFNKNSMNIVLDEGDAYIGGIAGKSAYDELSVFTANVSHTFNAASIHVDSLDEVEYTNQVSIGGLSGILSNTYITESYNSHNVTTTFDVGEISGYIQGSMAQDIFYINSEDYESRDAFFDIETDNVSANAIGIPAQDFSMSELNNLGIDWDISSDPKDDVDWVISSNAPRHPRIKHVGYTLIETTVSGGGNVSNKGVRFLPEISARSYNIVADNGYEISKLIINGEEYRDVRGHRYVENLVINFNEWEDNLVEVHFRQIPFYKTREFFILMALGGIVATMIAGTFIINYTYAKKLQAEAEKRKNTAKENIINHDNTRA